MKSLAHKALEEGPRPPSTLNAEYLRRSRVLAPWLPQVSALLVLCVPLVTQAPNLHDPS